ncbi:MAG: apolipoprotein N-acyltransferase [Bacteroidota bacterium]
MLQLYRKYRRWLPFFFFGFAAAIAYSMYNRTTQELLWGYRPLALYLALYFGYMSVQRREKSTSTAPQSPTPTGPLTDRQLAILGGTLLGLGYPGYLPYPILLFVAWVPLLLLQQRLVARGVSGRRVFGLGYATFFLFNVLSTYWVTNTALAAGLFALIVNSFIMCLPWWLFNRVSRWAPRVSYLAFFTPWLAFEYFHYRWQLNWPWLDLGNGLGQNPWMAQWYEYTGTAGGSLWILLVNYLLFRALFPSKTAVGMRWRSWGAVVGVFVLPQVFSLLLYQRIDTESGRSIYVVAINPNAEPHFEKFGQGSEQAAIDSFSLLSQAAVAAASGRLDYIVYPETSFGGINEDQPLGRNSPIPFLLERLPTQDFDYLVTGISAYHEFQAGEPLSKAVRYAGDRPYEVLNAALQFSTADQGVQTYRKGVFVPGAESFPYAGLLGFLGPAVDQLGGSLAGYGTQPSRSTLDGAARIGPAICYESVFGEYFTGYIKAGAEAIFVMTNDGWWDNTAGHRQHNWIASLRAIETRRAIVRAANLGNCSFINARGQIVSATNYDQMGYLLGHLQLREGETFYVRRGDFIGRVAALLSLMLMLSLVAQRLRGENEEGGLEEVNP